MNLYEVGDIFLTMSNESPALRFVGTWELIAKGRTLVGVDPDDSDFNVVEKTGGSKYLQKHIHMVTGGYGGALGTNDNSDRPATMRNSTGTRSVAGFTTSQPQKGYNNTSLQTGESGNLQPYLTCYIWCRTA